MYVFKIRNKMIAIMFFKKKLLFLLKIAVKCKGFQPQRFRQQVQLGDNQEAKKTAKVFMKILKG